MSKKKEIETHFCKIMEALGLDMSHPSLKKTPTRVAEMYLNELFVGLNPKAFPEMTLFPCEGEEGSTVSIEAIQFISMCEHHFLPIRGEAQVQYIPRKQIVGLSKIHRVVRYFAARPQLQERMGQQIADCLSERLGTPDVSIRLRARHDCLAMRGVEDGMTVVETVVQRGAFLS